MPKYRIILYVNDKPVAGVTRDCEELPTVRTATYLAKEEHREEECPQCGAPVGHSPGCPLYRE